MQDQQSVGVLPRHLRQVRIERVEDRPDAVHIHAEVDTEEAACPACQAVSSSETGVEVLRRLPMMIFQRRKEEIVDRGAAPLVWIEGRDGTSLDFDKTKSHPIARWYSEKGVWGLALPDEVDWITLGPCSGADDFDAVESMAIRCLAIETIARHAN